MYAKPELSLSQAPAQRNSLLPVDAVQLASKYLEGSQQPKVPPWENQLGLGGISTIVQPMLTKHQRSCL